MNMLKYKLKYDFRQYNKSMGLYLDYLLSSSSENFCIQVRRGKINNVNKETNILGKCIVNVEDYLYYYFINYPESFNSIFKLISNNVHTVACFPFELSLDNNGRGLFGQMIEDKKLLYINPDINASITLTKDERIKMYMAHELGHVINGEWMDKAVEFIIRQGLSQSEGELFLEGFAMLNEATTQERAEEFIYATTRKCRPSQDLYIYDDLFKGEPFKTNFDYYGELQALAIMFARTLRGIGKENDDDKVMSILAHRAISPDFFDNILNEYNKDGQMTAFMNEVYCMGYLKKASYANFGMDNLTYLRNSKRYLDCFKSITNSMRDYREPFQGYSL